MACALDFYFLGHLGGHFLYSMIKNKIKLDRHVLEFKKII